MIVYEIVMRRANGELIRTDQLTSTQSGGCLEIAFASGGLIDGARRILASRITIEEHSVEVGP